MEWPREVLEEVAFELKLHVREPAVGICREGRECRAGQAAQGRRSRSGQTCGRPRDGRKARGRWEGWTRPVLCVHIEAWGVWTRVLFVSPPPRCGHQLSQTQAGGCVCRLASAGALGHTAAL